MGAACPSRYHKLPIVDQTGRPQSPRGPQGLFKPGQLLTYHGESAALVLHAGPVTGRRPRFDDPQDIDALDRAAAVGGALPFDHTKFRSDEAQQAARLAHNGPRVIPLAAVHGDGGANLLLGAFYYSRYQAALPQWPNDVALQLQIIQTSIDAGQLGIVPGRTNDLGVVSTVVTANGWMLLQVRSAKAGHERERVATVMGEGVHPDHFSLGGTWAPIQSTLPPWFAPHRVQGGMPEEVGLFAHHFIDPATDGSMIDMGGPLIVQLETGNITAVGTARTNLTLEQVRKANAKAVDNWEGRMFAVRFRGEDDAVALMTDPTVLGRAAGRGKTRETLTSWCVPAVLMAIERQMGLPLAAQLRDAVAVAPRGARAVGGVTA